MFNQLLDHCRQFQSSQTKLIHWHYCDSRLDQVRESIPFVENFLFVLLLLKQRNLTAVAEAKELLERLIEFVHDENGGQCFPRYMHDFPKCGDRGLGTEVAPTLILILRFYHHGLGKELRQKMTDILEGLLSFAWVKHEERPLPFDRQCLLIACSFECDRLKGSQEYHSKYLRSVSHLVENVNKEVLFSSNFLGALFFAMQLSEDFSSELSKWKRMELISELWDSERQCYFGPAFYERQWDKHTDLQFYDLMMTYKNLGDVDQDLQLVDLSQVLRLAWLEPRQVKDFVQKDEFCFVEENDDFHIERNKKYALATLKKEAGLGSSKYKGLHPLRILWTEEGKTRNFVCQAPKAAVHFSKVAEKQWQAFFDLEGALEDDSWQGRQELAFYCDLQEKVEIRVEGHTATTFRLGEQVSIGASGLRVSLQVDLEEGEGRFLGHIFPGNRPAQLKNQGEYRFDAYDLQIFLRTIDRQEPCRIRVTLTIE